MKIYVGNLSDDGSISSGDIRPLFERFGKVTECECIKNYAFVHMEDESAASEAVKRLNGSGLKGRSIRVEKSESKGPRKPSQKLFVGNLSEGTSSEDLKELFEMYAPVVEADVIKNFGFVHIDADAGKSKVNEILRVLNGHNLKGSQIRVQLSTSGVRHKPGMGGDQCYRCGRDGHWSKECPTFPDPQPGYGDRGSGGGGGGRMGQGGGSGGRGGPMRGSAPYGGRSGMGGGQGMGGHSYGGRGDPYPPPPPPSYMRDRGSYDGGSYGHSPVMSGSGDGYGASRAYGGMMPGRPAGTDPYGRPTAMGPPAAYDDRRMAMGHQYQQQGMTMGADRSSMGPMRGPDPYGRYDTSSADMYGQSMTAAGYGGASAAAQYGGAGMGGSSAGAPAYSTQPSYSTGVGDMFSRRSPGSGGSSRGAQGQAGAAAATYGVQMRSAQGSMISQGGYGAPQQPAGAYGTSRGYGMY